jgi:hypothetical protein
MRRPDRARQGFTIVDTMVAALVMIIASVGLLSMQLVQVGAGLRARQLSEATALMQQKAEELRLLPVPQVAIVGPVERLDARGCPLAAPRSYACTTPLLQAAGPGTEYVRTYRVTPAGPATAQIEVRVSWQDPQGKRHEVSTIHAR